ncbi:MAG TPA: MarR family transcriptional regulator [Candidatus Limnocylindria bacterium]|nr:MarR family transcriptional regulator [Candidatus Limnocylindria bacterium]
MAVQRKAAREPTRLVEPRQRVGRLLIGVARELRTVVDRQVQPLGLTMQQAELLVWTHRQRGASPTQLTELLLTDDAGVSRLVDRLEAKGLITRRVHGRDRRARELQLTPSGRTLATRLGRFAARGNEKLLAGLSPQETAQLRRLLQRVSENLRTTPLGSP